ncbi:MAG: thermonuclease family protein [Candidatus Pacearchaeota archaeon]
MIKKEEILFVLFFIIILILSLFISGSGCKETENIRYRVLEQATIIEVIDGDTVKTSNNEIIRLLHVNTPEKGEKCYNEAKARLKELVENKTVWLERDMQDKDKYGRKLRYVFLSYNTDSKNFNDFVNLIMIREGLAALLMIEPNMKYQQVFKKAIEDASQEEGCIWSSKSQYFGCFSIQEFHYDAQGDDCKNANDEYVILKNTCEDISMKGWTIKDNARHVYTFKEFIAKKDALFTLHSGSGLDNDTDLFWNSNLECPSVWNNDHDVLFLRDSNDYLVLQNFY